jgi:uncharacterized protein (DUF608 family)
MKKWGNSWLHLYTNSRLNYTENLCIEKLKCEQYEPRILRSKKKQTSLPTILVEFSSEDVLKFGFVLYFFI